MQDNPDRLQLLHAFANRFNFVVLKRRLIFFENEALDTFPCLVDIQVERLDLFLLELLVLFF